MSRDYIIVGAGRCGLGLAGAMRRAAIPLAGIVSRSSSSRRRARRLFPSLPVYSLRPPLPDAWCYVIAVADDALAAVASALAPRLSPMAGRVAVHTSGFHPASALEPIRQAGAAVASLHPLFPFPPPTADPPTLEGAVAAIEGDSAAVRVSFSLARQLGMRPRRLAARDKPLYHAAAAVAGNLTHILLARARDMLLRTGFTRSEANAALATLVDGSCHQALLARGLERLSGPLARADIRTVEAHLAALPEDLAAVYLAIARAALPQLASRPGYPGMAASIGAGALTASSSCASVTLMPYGEGG